MHQFTGYYWKDCKGSTIQSRSLVKTVHWYEQRAKKNSKKKYFKKDFFKLMSNAVFEKIMEIVRKHRDIKLVTTKWRRSYLISKQNCHTNKKFSDNLLAIEIKITQILINKPVYLGLSILEISKIVMYEVLYYYVKPK